MALLAFAVVLNLGLPQAFSTVRENGVVPASSITMLRTQYLKLDKATSSSDVSLFHVDYPSLGYSGKETSLSGLIALPKTGAPKGLVLYFHGTTAEREFVPSRFVQTGGPIEAELAIAEFAGNGYAVIAPDYIGLGDSQDVHPYAISSVNCRAGIDMIAPARSFAISKGCPLGSALFVTGYSEGGAVAMWAAKTLEESPALPKITACAPMSGAYDLSGVEARFMLDSQSNFKWLAARFYLAAYLSLTFTRLNPPVKLDDLMVPSMASYVPIVFQRDKTDEQIVKDLATKGLEVGASQTIKRALQPDAVKALESEDAKNALVAKLRGEDCFDWLPTAPLRLIYLANDRLVSPENSRKALAAMRARGASEVLVRLDEIKERGFDHITFLPRALNAAGKFFDSISTESAGR